MTESISVEPADDRVGQMERGGLNYNRTGETFGSDRYVHFLDCSNSFTYGDVKTHQIVYFKYGHVIMYQLELDESLLKKNSNNL